MTERPAGTIAGIRYDHGVLLAMGGGTGGSGRVDGVYGHIALGACGDPLLVAQMHRASHRLADIRAWHLNGPDVSSRTMAFAYASVLMVMGSESPVLPDGQLLVGSATDLHEITSDGRVSEIDSHAAIGHAAADIVEDLTLMRRGGLDLDSACFLAIDALRQYDAELELVGVDDRRQHGGFFRIPSSLVARAQLLRSRAGGS